jgi:hypothetical protein
MNKIENWLAPDAIGRAIRKQKNVKVKPTAPRTARIVVVESQKFSDGSTAQNLVFYHDAEPLMRMAISGGVRDAMALAAMINDMACWIEEVK